MNLGSAAGSGADERQRLAQMRDTRSRAGIDCRLQRRERRRRGARVVPAGTARSRGQNRPDSDEIAPRQHAPEARPRRRSRRHRKPVALDDVGEMRLELMTTDPLCPRSAARREDADVDRRHGGHRKEAAPHHECGQADEGTAWRHPLGVGIDRMPQSACADISEPIGRRRRERCGAHAPERRLEVTCSQSARADACIERGPHRKGRAEIGRQRCMRSNHVHTVAWPRRARAPERSLCARMPQTRRCAGRVGRGIPGTNCAERGRTQPNVTVMCAGSRAPAPTKRGARGLPSLAPRRLWSARVNRRCCRARRRSRRSACTAR